MEFITKSARETKELGQKLATALKGRGVGTTLALMGELGSGKTTFVQGIAQGLGITSNIVSPTFILVRDYEIKDPNIKLLKHIDLYRLEGNLESELNSLGITDAWSSRDNLVVVEWADKVSSFLPESSVKITFENLEENERCIRIDGIEFS